MFYHNLDPALFHIGPFEIRYYGIIYVLSIVIGYFLFIYLAEQRRLGLTKDEIIDYFFYLIISIVAGARLFYVIFYNLSFYIKEPLQIFALWHGGMSFHGGLLAAVIFTFYFCKKKKLSFYKIADILVIPLALGLMLGRIGNFLNGELVGRISNAPWCVKFQNYEGCRHPSQLYESFKNLVIFITLWSIKDKKLKDGFLFWSFILMYSVLRFFIEFFRAPDPQIGYILGLTLGQILNIAMLIIALYFIKKK